MGEASHLDWLRRAMIDIYTKSLMLLAYLDRIHDRSAARQHLTAPYTLFNVDKYMRSLQGCENVLNQTGNDCQNAFSACERGRRQEEAQKIIDEITRLHSDLQHPM